MWVCDVSGGTYRIDGVLSFFLSKAIVEIPVVFIQFLLLMTLVYFAMGLQGNFWYLTLITYGLGLLSNSAAMFLSAVVPDIKAVAELGDLLFIPQILFGGVFIRMSLIPSYVRWAQWIVGLKYAMNLTYLTEFRVSMHECSDSSEAEANCEALLDDNDVEYDLLWVYILCMVAMALMWRVAAALVLKQSAKTFY